MCWVKERAPETHHSSLGSFSKHLSKDSYLFSGLLGSIEKWVVSTHCVLVIGASNWFTFSLLCSISFLCVLGIKTMTSHMLNNALLPRHTPVLYLSFGVHYSVFFSLVESGTCLIFTFGCSGGSCHSIYHTQTRSSWV